MDANVIVQIISSLGFPIAACVALFWKMNESDKMHKEETDKLSDVITNNTLTIQKLCDKMEGK